MVINTNIAAINSARLLGISSSQLGKSLARLSSGSRIVSPDDDSAGLAQSIKFDAQIRRGEAALINLICATRSRSHKRKMDICKKLKRLWTG